MSSVDLAKIAKKDHKNVIRDTEVIFAKLGESVDRLRGTHTDIRGQKQPCFDYGLVDLLVVTGQWDAVIRFDVIQDWIRREAMALSHVPLGVVEQILTAGSMYKATVVPSLRLTGEARHTTDIYNALLLTTKHAHPSDTLEVAKKLNMQHKNVVRDLRNITTALGIVMPPTFERDVNGRKHKAYSLSARS